MWKNEQTAKEKYLTTVNDVNGIIPEVLTRGQEFFADMEFNQINQQEPTILKQLARKGHQLKIDEQHGHHSLKGSISLSGELECVALAGCDPLDELTIGQCDALWCYKYSPPK